MDRGSEGSTKAPLARASLDLGCRSPEEAGVLWEAVRTDDPGAVEGRVEGDRLLIEAGPASLPSLRITLDDLLACIQAASGAAQAAEDEEVD